MVLYSCLLKNFPVCCDLHKGFGIINKAERDVFLEFSCFFDDPADVGNLISGSSSFDYAKAFDCVDHKKLWKILKEMGIQDHLTCLLRNLYAGQKATIRTGHGTTDWFQIPIKDQ